VAKPLSEHLTSLTSLREELDEMLTRGIQMGDKREPVRPEAIERLARARAALADLVLHLREGCAAAGLRKG